MSTEPTNPRQFEQTLELDAPRDAVWKALTQSDEVARWFAPSVTFEPKVGGAVVWDWSDHFHWPQTVEVFEPDTHLRTRYEARIDGGAPTQVPGPAAKTHPLFIDFRLTGDGGSTTLRIVHSGFGADSAFDEEFEGISHGWPIELQSLRNYVERHAGRDRHLTWSKATLDLDADTAWRQLTSDSGLKCGPGIDQLAEGAPFEFCTAAGDTFAGEVIATHPRELAARVSSHDDGFLRIWAGDFGGRTHLWLWLATYGDAAPDGLQERWDALIQSHFAAHITTQAAS